MARLIQVDFDPFASADSGPRLTLVDFDPFDVVRIAEERRRAGTLPPDDPRDVEAQRRLDRSRNVRAGDPSSQSRRPAPRLPLATEVDDLDPLASDIFDENRYRITNRREQPIRDAGRPQRFEDAPEEARDALAFVGTRINQYRPDEHPGLFRRGRRLTNEEIADAVTGRAAEIEGLDPEVAIDRLFGNEDRRRNSLARPRDVIEAPATAEGAAREERDYRQRVISEARALSQRRDRLLGEDSTGVERAGRGLIQNLMASAQDFTSFGARGIAEILRDGTGLFDTPAEYVDELANWIGRDAASRRRAADPGYERGSVPYYAFGITRSLLDLAAATGVAVTTRNPSLTVSVAMGGIVGGQEAQRAVEAGYSEREALAIGALYGLTEALPEKIAVEQILRAARPAASAVGRVARGAAVGAVSEGVQEDVTELLQIGLDRGIFDERVSLAEAGRRLLDAGIMGAGAGAGLGAGFAGASEIRDRLTRPGRIEQAEEVELTPEDVASPIPNDAIAEGRIEIERALAGESADQVLDDAIGGRTGDKITIDLPDGSRTGTVKDQFTEEDDELGPQAGVVIEWDEGGESRERASDLRDAGARVRPAQPLEGAQAREIMRNRIRQVESGGNDNARNPRSSASGRYQFTDETFNSYFQRVYGRAARPDERNNPQVQERLMDALLDDNERSLRRNGHAVTPGNLYLSHFLGSGGANVVLRDPDRSIEELVGERVVRANPFLRGMTGRDVAAWAESRMTGQPYAGARPDPETDYDSDTLQPDYSWIEETAIEDEPAAPGVLDNALSNGVSTGYADTQMDTGISGMAARQGAMPESTQQGISSVRGPGNNDLPGVGGRLPGVSGSPGTAPVTEALGGPDRRDEGLRAGERPVGDAARASPESTRLRSAADLLRSDNDRGGMGERARDTGTDDLSALESGPRSARGSLSEEEARRAGAASFGARGGIPSSEGLGAASGAEGYDASGAPQAGMERGGRSGDGSRSAPIEVVSEADIRRAEQQARDPTPGQAEVGNYRHAHLRLHGLDIAIETPKGAMRRGVDTDGNAWEAESPAAYGRIKRTVGGDGEQIDVYIGDNPTSTRAFVIDQYDPETGNFDETKTVLGVDSREEAIQVYDDSFSDGSGPTRRRGVTEMPVDQFREWAASDASNGPAEIETQKPVADLEVGNVVITGGERLRVVEIAGNRPVLEDGTRLAPGGTPRRVVVQTGANAAPDAISAPSSAEAQLPATAAPLTPEGAETASFRPDDRVADLAALKGKVSINDMPAIAKRLGVDEAQARAIVEAGIGAGLIEQTFGRPAKFRKQLVRSAVMATSKNGKRYTKRAAQYRRVQVEPEVPSKFRWKGKKKGSSADVLSVAAGLRDDEGHDLAKSRSLDIFIPGVGKLLRKNGHQSLDDLGESLMEQGFFQERPTVAEVLDLLEYARSEHLKGRKVFAEVDIRAVEQRRPSDPDGEAEYLARKDAENEQRLRSAIEFLDIVATEEQIAEAVRLMGEGQSDTEALANAVGREGAAILFESVELTEDQDYIDATEAVREADTRDPGQADKGAAESEPRQAAAEGAAEEGGRPASESDPAEEGDGSEDGLKTPFTDEGYAAWEAANNAINSEINALAMREGKEFDVESTPELEALIDEFAMIHMNGGNVEAAVRKAIKDRRLEIVDGGVPALLDVKPMPPSTVVPAPARTVNAASYAGPFIAQAEAAERLAEWKAEAKRIGQTKRDGQVILSLFDASGRFSQPYRDMGFEVYQIDLKHGDDIMEDFRQYREAILEMQRGGARIVGVIAQPPCTTMTVSGARWWKERHERAWANAVQKMWGPKAAQVFDTPLEYNQYLVAVTEELIGLADPDFFAIENPVGRIEKITGLPKPLLTFQPHHFGDAYTKKTNLWGKFNPILPTANVSPKEEDGGEGSKMHKLRSSDEKDGGLRSLTSEPFAYAFALANAPGVATSVSGEQPAPAAEQADMFGTKPGDARRALEQKTEGRKKSTAKQKAPGENGGLFDVQSQTGDLLATQPESKEVETARARVENLSEQMAENLKRRKAGEISSEDFVTKETALNREFFHWSQKLAELESGAPFGPPETPVEAARAALQTAMDLLDGKTPQAPAPAPEREAAKPEEPPADEPDQPMYQRSLLEGDDPVFYSALERAISGNPTKRASAAQWAATLGKTPGIKREELEWSGLFEWLDMQEGPVERDALLAVIRDGGIRVEEVVLGGKPDQAEVERRTEERINEIIDGWIERQEIDTGSHFAEETENGFVVYGPYADETDTYDTLEAAEAAAEQFNERQEADVRSDLRGDIDTDQIERNVEDELTADTETQFDTWSSDPSNPTYRELLITLPRGQDGNPERAPATHWDQEAVVAHARLMEKTDADGKRVLFVEEIQSDWHQKGRDEGYETEISQEEMARRDQALLDATEAFDEATQALIDKVAMVLRERLDDADAWADDPAAKTAVQASLEQVTNEGYVLRVRGVEAMAAAEQHRIEVSAQARAREQARLRLTEAQVAASRRAEGFIPDAPFKSSWPALVMKRLIRYAADNGFDKVAWTTGEEQNERYSLEKFISAVELRRSAGGVGNPDMGPLQDGERLRFVAFGEGDSRVADTMIESKSELYEYLPRDVADRLWDAKPVSEPGGGGWRDATRRLTGLDVRSGGDGMRAFYDRNLVNIANDLLKKHGGKVGRVNLAPQASSRGAGKTLADYQADLARIESMLSSGNLASWEVERWEEQHRDTIRRMEELGNEQPADLKPGFEITPELAAAARSGFPLFSQRANAARPVSDEQLSEIIGRLQAEMERLGIADRISLKVANGLLAKERAQGAYFRRVIQIAADQAANPSATLNHEAIHAIKALGLFTQSEWTSMVKRAWADPGVAAYVRRGYPMLSDMKRDEEAVAEFYSRWRTQRMEAKGFVRQAFMRLMDFLNAVRQAWQAVTKGELLSPTVMRRIEKGKIGRRETGAGIRWDEAPAFQSGEDGFDFDAPQPKTGMSERDRAEIEARLKQSRIGRLGQKSVKDQEGGLFDVERDQGMLFQRQRAATVWNDIVNRLRSPSGAAKTPGSRDKFAMAYDRFRTAIQDRMLPVLRTQTAIEQEIGRTLEDGENPYRAEELMSGRIGARLERLDRDMVSPFFDLLREEKVSLDEFESYLYARHAPERNAYIRSINPEFGQGGGSGMTDIEAAAIMKRIKDAGKTGSMERLATKIDEMIGFALDTRVDAGLLSAKDAATLRARWQNYVPLRGFAETEHYDDGPRVGRGITVRGPESKRAFGRKSAADDIVAHVIMQAEEAIFRGEKNRVGQELYKLVKDNPDKDFWQIHKVSMRKTIDKETGQVTNQLVTSMQEGDEPYTVSLKIDGKPKRVTFNRSNPAARRAAEAMRRLEEQSVNSLIGFLSKVNRYLSAVNTSLNPEFVITNAFRDIQTAAINLAGVDVKGIEKGTIADYFPALFAATKGSFGKDDGGEWADWWNEFTQAGGRVFHNQLQDLETLRADIEKRFKRATISAKDKKTASERMLIARGNAAKVLEFIEAVNQGVENAVRLSAYKNARERGLSQSQAAGLAKGLTVNFNKRGTYGVVVNSLYLFANASMQGSARILMAMKHKRVQKIVAGIVAFGALNELMNVMLSAVDDDDELEYDKISDFEKSRNIIIMVKGPWGDYLKLPMPWGYNAFHRLGRYFVEIARGRPIGGRTMDLATTFIDAFNPIGGSDNILSVVSPTIFDPAVDLERNRDFAGRPIMPDQRQFGPETPNNQRYWGSVSPYWRDVTDFLNKASGGDEVVPGSLDVSPEVLEHLFGVGTGAAGAFVDRMVSMPLKLFDGDPDTVLTRNDIPLVRKVAGSVPDYYDRAAFYARIEQIEQAAAFARGYRTRGDIEGMRRYVEQHRDQFEIRPAVKQARREMRRVNRARDRLVLARDLDRISDDQYRNAMTILRAREQRIVTGFNRYYNNRIRDRVGPE